MLSADIKTEFTCIKVEKGKYKHYNINYVKDTWQKMHGLYEV